ncbi:uncharacterized protein K452DRAFT_33809 [Aplosporella prunicola CBS 121167]|uniref:UBX domain-containing protein n=1 Tax=Aplosporella prunicola CBS 121167 TaxID=1176127 RepID=A0A6A6BCC7_9PEZI|nr:uncharacterized protein K452DRAFT_33809 [Aplosporella prunicola CBS 121167]KAF2141790.1 hypothetical protein K452DRAFT_33809 [Aplosporella prunicola CBS 121167]
MSSHVVVIDASARRATVKTTPGKHLSDVLHEACTKLGVDANQHTFNNKPLDLSRTIRIAALPQGAKLDLIQASRSPSVVNVALAVDGQRYTHKFPSNKSLWQILRTFEEVVDAKPKLNFTQRAVPIMAEGSSGAGRMNYELPVINVESREFGEFTELQKTLGQLGYGGGSILMRMRFKDSGRPVHEAMADISGYFEAVDPPAPAQTTDAHGAHAGGAGESQSAPDPVAAAPAGDVAGEANPSEPTTSAMEDVVPTTSADTTPAPEAPPAAEAPPATEAAPTSAAAAAADPEAPPPGTLTGPDQRPMRIFYPSSSAPATRNAYNEADYVPTVDHAKSHQAALQTASRNKRLASDAELAAQAQAKADKLAAVKSVTIRVRLPDATHLEAEFSSVETAAQLHALVRSVLTHPDQPFALKYPNTKGGLGMATLAAGPARLVSDLGFQGRVLVNFVWEPGAAVTAKREPVLAPEWRDKGQELRAQEPVAEPVEEREEKVVRREEKKAPVDKEARLKSILGKGLFKKK